MKIKELFEFCGLCQVTGEPSLVSGGLMHSMYAVETKGQKYAVKKMNPMVMAREGVYGHVSNSEQIGIELMRVVPGVPALLFEGKPIIEFEGDYYIVFHWKEGASIFPPNISPQNCAKIGEVLGRIHRLDFRYDALTKEQQRAPKYDWERYIELGVASNASWLCEAKEILSLLIEWNDAMIKAANVLSQNQVISHRDMDPKNVMWQGGQPLLIDWEAAGYVNPYQELLELLSYWADDGKGGLIRENFDALLNAYCQVTNIEDADWEIVFAGGYSGLLGWLDYSFKRSLGLETGSEEERLLGTEQVVATIQELKNYTMKVPTFRCFFR